MKLDRLFDKKTIDAETLCEERVERIKILPAIREIYKGVNIRWGIFAIGFVLMAASYLILALTAAFTAEIQLGMLTDMSKVVAMILMHIVAWLLALGGYLGTKAGLTAGRDVQDKLWQRILRLPLTDYAQESPERLISRVTSDVDLVVTPFTLLQASGVLIVVTLVGILGMPATHFAIRLTFFICIALILVYIFQICKVARKAALIMTNRLSKLAAFLSERLFNMRLIKGSCSEEQELAEANRIIDIQYETKRYNAFATLLTEAVTKLGTLSLLGATFLVGAILNAKQVEGISIESVYGFYTYGTMLVTVIATFAAFPVLLAALAGGADKFIRILKARPEDTATGQAIPTTQGDLRFEGATFAYREGDTVLSNITVTIPKGKVTALRGKNGSGKSTIIKLIDRMYPLSGGKLYFGEEDAENISLQSWRSRFGVVSQNASLMSGTIRENVCYGLDREVPQEELERVAALSNLDAVLKKLSEGWEAQVGTTGSHLSGGEQQRVAIARALVKNPDYLILDEATANLDAESAHAIISGLKELMRGRTTIMVAHNEDFLKTANHIIDLKYGKLVEENILSNPH